MSMQKFIKKDESKLMKQMAKGEVYMKGITKEQETIKEKAEGYLKKVNSRLNELRKGLEPLVAEGKNDEEKANEYRKLLIDRDNLIKTIQIADETIAEYGLKDIAS